MIALNLFVQLLMFYLMQLIQWFRKYFLYELRSMWLLMMTGNWLDTVYSPIYHFNHDRYYLKHLNFQTMGSDDDLFAHKRQPKPATNQFSPSDCIRTIRINFMCGGCGVVAINSSNYYFAVVLLHRWFVNSTLQLLANFGEVICTWFAFVWTIGLRKYKVVDLIQVCVLIR